MLLYYNIFKDGRNLRVRNTSFPNEKGPAKPAGPRFLTIAKALHDRGFVQLYAGCLEVRGAR